ncbi:hypothetical protein SUGI_0781610, partial [Cryptomeria japonica]
MKWNYTKSSTALGFFGGTMGTLYQLKSCFNLLLLWLLFALHAAYSKTFSYGEFNKSSIILLKDASIHSERVLTLTNQTLRSMGRALYPTQITVKSKFKSEKWKEFSVLKEEVYVGFSAATGSYGVENHYILGWSFSSEGKAPALDLSGLPSFSRKNPITKSKGFEAAMAVASLVLLLIAVFFAFHEGETDGLLASALKSVESATTSTSHIYEKDSDYD